jgi:hypothetical protein
LDGTLSAQWTRLHHEVIVPQNDKLTNGYSIMDSTDRPPSADRRKIYPPAQEAEDARNLRNKAWVSYASDNPTRVPARLKPVRQTAFVALAHFGNRFCQPNEILR